ncbi:MAG: phosphate ABC transporter ATP-binding protein PstB [Candidatus Bathyarchaeota archaeon]|nr:phosphate ABC transporter ATP-binding protein PstB [Candidatus Bathyarchaeota archaeon]
MENIKLQSVDLNVWFGTKQALKDINLSMEANSVTAIIGPSGCGKSTFIRTLNRMHELTPNAKLTGKVLLDGQDVYAPNVDAVMVRRRVGMVFQKPNPFPTMSIYDNVAAGLKLTGAKKGKNLDEVVKRSLQQASLWEEVKDDLKKPGTSISGGQQQRLCIARAIALQPEVILMDEPCSALDPIATAKIEKLVIELKKDYTVVIVTHNMQQASRVSDYTAFFYLGSLVEFGETSGIFESPKNPLTEKYITGEFG